MSAPLEGDKELYTHSDKIILLNQEFSFAMSILFVRGIEVSYKTIENRNDKFGDKTAEKIGKQRAKPSRTWNFDEVHVKIRGEHCYLCRAVEEKGIVLDAYMTERRNQEAAKQFFGRLLGSYERPMQITSDRLRSDESIV